MAAKEIIMDTQALLNANINANDSEASGVTRRLALQTAIGVGYAAAAAPLIAQTAIKTSSDGLVAGEVIVDVGGFKMNAYRAAPAGKTNLPVVLVVQEIFGVHEYIADICRRFAKAGYLAIAGEFFQRQGDPTKYNNMADLQREVVTKVPDAQVMTDLDACVAWAAKNGGNVKRLGGSRRWSSGLGRSASQSLRPKRHCSRRQAGMLCQRGHCKPSVAAWTATESPGAGIKRLAREWKFDESH